MPVPVAMLEATLEARPFTPVSPDPRTDVPVAVEVNEAVMVASISPAIVDTPVLVVTPVKYAPVIIAGLNE